MTVVRLARLRRRFSRIFCRPAGVRGHLDAGGALGVDDQPPNPAVLVRDFKAEKTFIITRSDIMRVLM